MKKISGRKYDDASVPAILGGLPIQDFLRIVFFTVVFFFVEFHFLQTTWHNPEVLRFPLFENPFSQNPSNFYIVEFIYISCMIAMSWRQVVIPAGLLGATAALVLINMDLQARYQFDYLPLWMFLCFSLSEVLRRSEDFKDWADFPYVVLMATIYDFSVYHKVINYQFMLTDLPGEVFDQAEGFFGPLCTRADCLILKLITWGTIPIEFILGVLMAGRRWLRPRIVFAILFHWMVAVMAEVIAVSFMLFLIHVIVANLQSPKTQIFKNRRWFVFFATEVFWILGFQYFSAWVPDVWQITVAKTCWVNIFLYPVIFLLLPYLSTPVQGELQFPSWQWPTWILALRPPVSRRALSMAGFMGLNLLFGFAPLLMEKQYSVYNVGWAMFSGGYKRNPPAVLKTPADDCHSYPNVYGLIFRKKEEGQFIYIGKRQADIDQLRNYFELNRNCPFSL